MWPICQQTWSNQANPQTLKILCNSKNHLTPKNWCRTFRPLWGTREDPQTLIFTLFVIETWRNQTSPLMPMWPTCRQTWSNQAFSPTTMWPICQQTSSNQANPQTLKILCHSKNHLTQENQCRTARPLWRTRQNFQTFKI